MGWDGMGWEERVRKGCDIDARWVEIMLMHLDQYVSTSISDS